MNNPARLACLLVCAALLLAGPVAAQSSLGGSQTLAPPAPPAATPPRPAAAPQSTSRPAQPAATSPRAATAPKPGTAPPRQAATPTVRATPGASGRPPAQAAQTPQQRRRAAAAAAAAGAAAAGAATAARPTAPAPPPEPPAPRVGSATNLPLPRYASLGSNQVNLRVGPDLRYPIEWTYQRKELPVQIVDEHQLWRRIRDPEGTEGWVQRPLLTSRRSFLVPAGADRILRRKPEADGAEVAHLRPGVVGRIRKCDAGSAWCEVQVGDYRGFLRRSEIWGVTADEAVN